jgi:tripartite-type tricarboxylate transporter receptor subunit TctC
LLLCPASSDLAKAPGIPTAKEAGVSGLSVSFWHGLWAPKRTPKKIIAQLNEAVIDALFDANVRSRLTDLSQDLFPREQLTPQGLAAHHKAEIEKWWPIMRAAAIKAE